MDDMNMTMNREKQESAFEQSVFTHKEEQKQELSPYAQQFGEGQKQIFDELKKRSVAKKLSDAFAMRGKSATQLVVPAQSVLSGQYKNAFKDRSFFFKTRESKIANLLERLARKEANASKFMTAEEEEEEMRKIIEELIRALSMLSVNGSSAPGPVTYDLSKLAYMFHDPDETVGARFSAYNNQYNQADSEGGQDE